MKLTGSVLRGGGLLIALSFFLCFASTAHAQSIGLYADGNCTSCSLEITAGETRTIFVSGPTSGLPDPRDFAGGEFRILGVPNGWAYQVFAAEGILLIGDPLGPNGASVAIFDPPTNYCRLIFTFTLTAT